LTEKPHIPVKFHGYLEGKLPNQKLKLHLRENSNSKLQLYKMKAARDRQIFAINHRLKANCSPFFDASFVTATRRMTYATVARYGALAFPEIFRQGVGWLPDSVSHAFCARLITRMQQYFAQ